MIIFFLLKSNSSYNSNTISPVVPSADNSQENYEIPIASDANFLSPLEQLFLDWLPTLS